MTKRAGVVRIRIELLDHDNFIEEQWDDFHAEFENGIARRVTDGVVSFERNGKDCLVLRAWRGAETFEECGFMKGGAQ